MKPLSTLRRAFAAVSGWLNCEKQLAAINADVYPKAYAALDTKDPTERIDAISAVWKDGFTAYNTLSMKSATRIFAIFAPPAIATINASQAMGPLTPGGATLMATGLTMIFGGMAALQSSVRSRARHTDDLVPTFKAAVLDVMVNDPVAFRASEMGQRVEKRGPKARQQLKTHLGRAFIRPYRNLAKPENRP